MSTDVEQVESLQCRHLQLFVIVMELREGLPWKLLHMEDDLILMTGVYEKIVKCK